MSHSHKLINAKEAGEIYGKSPSRAAKLGRDHHAEGYRWPEKVGRQWLAPKWVWKEILVSKSKHRRKLPASNKSKKLITASEAARKLHRNPNWISELGKRNKRRGGEWPQKIGNYWLAPFEEWKHIEGADNLRSWKRKKFK